LELRARARRNYQVVAANHTLVLNWNAQTVPLLRQIAINRAERGEGVYSGCACWPAWRRLAVRSICLSCSQCRVKAVSVLD